MLHLAVEKFCPSIDFFLNLIHKETPFQFAKLNHAFWDTALSVKKNPNMLGADVSAWRPDGWIYFHGMEFMLDMFDVIADVPNTPLFLAASECAAPGLCQNQNKDHEIRDLIAASFPRRYRLFYGPIMKKYALDGMLQNMVEAFAEKYDVLVVGLPHTEKIKEKFAFKSFRHFQLDLHKTTPNRFFILEQMRDMIVTMEKPAVLFQAGESLSLWFIYHLQKSLPHVTMIDMGRTLDVWAVPDNSPKSLPDMKNPLWKNLFQKT